MGSYCRYCIYRKDCSPLEKNMEDECLVIDLLDVYDEEFYQPFEGEYYWGEMSYYLDEIDSASDGRLDWDILKDDIENDSDCWDDCWDRSFYFEDFINKEDSSSGKSLSGRIYGED